MSAELLRELTRAKVAFQLRAIEAVIRGPAIAAATGTAKTPQAVECEASQSGAESASPKHPIPSSTLDMD